MNGDAGNTRWKGHREGLGQNLKTVQERCSEENYALREFWEIFVDGRLFGADACFRHVNVQSKAVFSYAMTIMDEIYAYVTIYTKEALTKGQIPNPAMEEYLKKRMLSNMLCTNWVCAGTFVDHEWVSESTITQHVEEVMGMELEYKICIPCVVQWCMLWFPAPTRLNRT